MANPEHASRSLIESDAFPFEFVSKLGERESWRKEVHRPVYHVHKWWAKRLGSVFRAILLGSSLPTNSDLEQEFYKRRAVSRLVVFDPFMGSGTTVGEAHKLGFVALGQDINAVAAEAVRVALGPIDRRKLQVAYDELAATTAPELLKLYRGVDSRGRACDVLYNFWVMQCRCPACAADVDLFPSYVIARNAYPDRKPEVRIVCPFCGNIETGLHGQQEILCSNCERKFDPESGAARGSKAKCCKCSATFPILVAVAGSGGKPNFRLFAKLVLTPDGTKEYLATTREDLEAYARCSEQLNELIERGAVRLPTLNLEDGYNTRQAISYGFLQWRDFFGARQLLALALLHDAITRIEDVPSRDVLLALFSGTLEFNNLFASYKGEGTGAVRHMFSHHILKPERTPIEANVWGTSKSSGAFSTLYRTRLLRALDYRDAPTELSADNEVLARVCANPFVGSLRIGFPSDGRFQSGTIYLERGDSSSTNLPSGSVDLVVTDPPFFDNVHYSELADFFYAWQQLSPRGFIGASTTTRQTGEVQDTDSASFTAKLAAVFAEARRVLKDDGLLVFSYHHSRSEGWTAIAEAILQAGFVVVNSHPVKSEMSVATPKTQARDPIQLDIVIVCRKAPNFGMAQTIECALASAISKIERLRLAGFELSRNDRRIVLFGQLLTVLREANGTSGIAGLVESELAAMDEKQTGRVIRTDADERNLALFASDRLADGTTGA